MADCRSSAVPAENRENQRLNLRCEVPIPFHLLYADPDLERTIDLAVLHEVSPDDALVLIAFIYILRKVEFHSPQQILLDVPSG